MVSPQGSWWTPTRIAAWALTAAVVAVNVGPTAVRVFWPPEGAYTDFIQEWLTARNYFRGDPIYRDVTDSAREHLTEPRRPFDPMIAVIALPAHPPGAVLVGLPFGLLDYPHAHLVWNLLTGCLFLCAAALVVVELKVPFSWPSVFPAAILLLGNPVLNQLFQGQMNCLLAALVTSAWVADRRGRPALAGVLVGLAGAIKLFPLFLLAYFLFTRRWAGLAAAVVAFLAVNGLAAAAFGVGVFPAYFGQVVPAVTGRFQTAWGNVSLTGFWVRLFETEPLRQWVGPDVALRAGRAFVAASSLAVAAVVARVSWRAADRDDRDRAFGLAVAGMLLASPLTWAHYYLLLVLPLALVWMRADTSLARWLWGAVVAVLWLPPRFAAQAWLGRAGSTTFIESTHPQLTTAEDLGLVAVPHYALVALFLLLALCRARPAGSPKPIPAPVED
jgi:alpha-1,2-mannosyltransferase